MAFSERLRFSRILRIASLVIPLAIGGMGATERSAQAQTPQASSPENLRTAQSLYDLALKEMDDHKYAQACVRLEEAVRLVPEGVGAKLSLAECYEGWGKLGTAYGAYLSAADAARIAKQTEREKLATQRAMAIEPRVARLTIVVPQEVAELAGLVVLRDGAEVRPGQWGAPIVVDAGTYNVTVDATGRARATLSVTIKNGEKRSIDLKAGEAISAGPTATATASSAPTIAPSVTPAPTASAQGGSALRPAGIALTIAGAAVLAGGFAAGGLALAKQGDAKTAGCTPGSPKWQCPNEESANFVRESLMAGNWSTGLVIGGGIAAAAGIVLLVVAPSRPESRAGVGVRIGPSRIEVQGSF